MSEIDLRLDIEVLLDILLKTTVEYMKAFEVNPEDIKLTSEMLKKYQAFKLITAYYMDDKDECISFVSFSFDWEKYELIYKSDDPEIVINRKSIVSSTPKQILEDACKIINSKVKTVKRNRNYKYIKMVYTYTDNVWYNETLLETIRKETGLVPFDKSSLKFSSKIKGYQTRIDSSLTEFTLSIDFVV